MIQKLKSNYVTWEEEKIGQICQLINGRAFKPTEWSSTGLKIVRIQNLNNETKPFNYYDQPIDAKFLINNGEVLISWSGTPGTSFGAHLWNRGEAVLNQHIFRVVLDESKCLKKFFIYAINWRIEELICKAHGGVGLRHITKKELENITIPIPFKNDYKRSLDIQTRIVARIEALLTEVQESRSLINKIRCDIEKIISVALEEMTQIITPARKILIDVIESKPRNGWSPKCDNNPEGIFVLKLGAVLRFRYNPNEVKLTSEPVDWNGHYWLNPGDILISRSNTPELVGHAAIYSGEPYPCIYPDLIMKMTVKKSKADSHFLIYWLQTKEVRDYIKSHASGASSTMKKIVQNHVCNIPFPKISLEEQIKLTSYLDSIKNETDEMLKLVEQDTKLLDMLEQSILERAFRGEL